MSEVTKQYPLILVCYMDRELMKQKEIMSEIANGIDLAIADRGANAMAFFLPTDGEERIECINPIHTTKKQNDKIEKMIKDIQKSFDIGEGADEYLGEDYEGSAVRPFKGDD
jgi:hypothetical protein